MEEYWLFLEKEIVEWATDRGIIQAADRLTQSLKTSEEVAELTKNILKGRDISDDIGDIFVTIAVQANMNGFTIDECMYLANPTLLFKSPDVSHKEVLVKIIENNVRLCNGILYNSLLEVKCAIANIFRLTTYICNTSINCMEFEDCVQLAYNEISKRKGKMVDGVFIKESDNV